MWAIPILGFIGTVQGLGVAVAGFGVLGGMADVSAIKSAIGQVTVGLGVAFDTTLLALILTTILMFPLISFQRKEEGLFGELDNYIDDLLLARFPSPEQKPIVIENLEDSIEAGFHQYIPTRTATMKSSPGQLRRRPRRWRNGSAASATNYDRVERAESGVGDQFAEKPAPPSNPPCAMWRMKSAARTKSPSAPASSRARRSPPSSRASSPRSTAQPSPRQGIPVGAQKP